MNTSPAGGNAEIGWHRRTTGIDLPPRYNSSTLRANALALSAAGRGQRCCRVLDHFAPRITIPLRGHHGGSGAVTFWTVERPHHGTLSDLRLLGDNRATIVYQQSGAESARVDRFSYIVKASGDRVSSQAEVRIFVEEPPARLLVPARIEFDEIMAGESETRQLSIRNEGGGVLEGRLTVSAPWGLGLSDYRRSGRTANNLAFARLARCRRNW